MILDQLNAFSESQALTSGAAVSTNVIDLTIDRNIGIGEPLVVAINVEVAADNADADETYTFDLQSGSTATPTTIVASVGYGGTNEPSRDILSLGYIVYLDVPANTTTDQFLRLNYTLGGTTPTVTVSAHLQPKSMIQNDVPGGYGIGYTVS